MMGEKQYKQCRKNVYSMFMFDKQKAWSVSQSIVCFWTFYWIIRDVVRSKNLEGSSSNMEGIICPPLVRIWLTDQSKSEGVGGRSVPSPPPFRHPYSCMHTYLINALHCKFLPHENYGYWELRGPCSKNLHYLWKRAVRITKKPYVCCG